MKICVAQTRPIKGDIQRNIANHKKLIDLAVFKGAETVLMSNCVGKTGDMECGGRTSIWNNKGLLVGQLDDTNEGVIIINTDTEKIIKKI